MAQARVVVRAVGRRRRDRGARLGPLRVPRSLLPLRVLVELHVVLLPVLPAQLPVHQFLRTLLGRGLILGQDLGRRGEYRVPLGEDAFTLGRARRDALPILLVQTVGLLHRRRFVRQLEPRLLPYLRPSLLVSDARRLPLQAVPNLLVLLAHDRVHVVTLVVATFRPFLGQDTDSIRIPPLPRGGIARLVVAPFPRTRRPNRRRLPADSASLRRGTPLPLAAPPRLRVHLLVVPRRRSSQPLLAVELGPLGHDDASDDQR